MDVSEVRSVAFFVEGQNVDMGEIWESIFISLSFMSIVTYGGEKYIVLNYYKFIDTCSRDDIY